MSDSKKRRRIDPTMALRAMTSQPGTMNGGFPAPASASPANVPPAAPEIQQPEPESAMVSPAPEEISVSPAIPAVETVSEAPAAPAPEPKPTAPRPAPTPRRKSTLPATPAESTEDELPPMVLRVRESYREPLTKTKRLLKLAGTSATLSEITQAALDYYLPLVEQHRHLLPPSKK